MNNKKTIFIIGFALFASFFGAGNLILPPQLGFNSGPDWWLVALGFITSATVIPLLALFGHAKLQGTMLDFGNKVSPLFSLVYCLCVYIIAVTLPIPRTAAVTHEMAIQPFFDTATNTVSYVVVDTETKQCAIIDSVLDFDFASGRTTTANADNIIQYIEMNKLTVEWILETHVHADHLSAAPYLQERLGGDIAIGENIITVQETFGKIFNEGTEFERDGSQFDRLLRDTGGKDDSSNIRRGRDDLRYIFLFCFNGLRFDVERTFL